MTRRERRPIDDLFVIQNRIVDAGRDAIDRLLAAHAGARSWAEPTAYVEHLAVLMDFARSRHIEAWRLRDCLSQVASGNYPRDRKLDPRGGNDQLDWAGPG